MRWVDRKKGVGTVVGWSGSKGGGVAVSSVGTLDVGASGAIGPVATVRTALLVAIIRPP